MKFHKIVSYQRWYYKPFYHVRRTLTIISSPNVGLLSVHWDFRLLFALLERFPCPVNAVILCRSSFQPYRPAILSARRSVDAFLAAPAAACHHLLVGSGLHYSICHLLKLLLSSLPSPISKSSFLLF